MSQKSAALKSFSSFIVGMDLHFISNYYFSHKQCFANGLINKDATWHSLLTKHKVSLSLKSGLLFCCVQEQATVAIALNWLSTECISWPKCRAPKANSPMLNTTLMMIFVVMSIEEVCCCGLNCVLS